MMETKTAKPAEGLETIQWVLAAIKANPELHDQSHWEEVTDCGTAMCVAGWACFAHRDALEQQIADYKTNPPCSCCELPEDDALRDILIPQVARQVMDLDFGTTQLLFYAENPQAVAVLEILAAGEPLTEEKWKEIEDEC